MMKKLNWLHLPKWLLFGISLGLFIVLGYYQFYSNKGQPLVQLAQHDEERLLQYQRERSARHYEFKLQPRQSLYCAGRIYCIEQSATPP